MLEEYAPEVRHVKGERNVVADALSRLDMEDNPSDTRLGEETPQPLEYTFVSAEDVEHDGFPMLPALIAKRQKDDKELLQLQQNATAKQHITEGDLEGSTVVYYKNKVYVPASLRQRIVAWTHEYLAHPGANRLEETLRVNFYWPRLRQDVTLHCKTCHQCQTSKKQRKKYGHTPPKEAETTPWKRVNVDIIGPYTVRTPSEQRTLWALTMIDPVTGWFEVAALGEEAPDSDIVQQTFDSVWLACYPRPQEIGIDNGKPFMRLFKDLCKNMGIHLKTITAHNPQGNSIVERIHQVLGNALRTAKMQTKDLDKRYPFDEFLSAAAYAIRCTYHTTLKATPGQLVFGRDMYLPTKFVADWAQIALRKQGEIDRSNERENSTRIAHDYHVGDLVLIQKPGILPKMEAPREGPYVIAVVHSNGTLTIQKGPVTERINIRRVQPYFPR